MAEDKYLTLQTTPAGMNMIVRSLYGDKITFTKIVIGDGHPTDLSNVTALAHQVLSAGITKADAKTDYLLLTSNISSANVPRSFYGYELGVYAKGADGTEQLYAYRYAEADVDFYPAADAGRTLELTMSVVVQVGNAKNVTAILVEGEAYARADHKHSAADITSGVLPVERGGIGAAAFTDCELAAVKTVKLKANEWSYSVPYSQTVKVTGITAKHSPVISCGLPDSPTADSVKAMRKAFGLIDRAVTGAGQITFYSYRDRPKSDVTAVLKGV